MYDSWGRGRNLGSGSEVGGGYVFFTIVGAGVGMSVVQ